MARQNQGFRKDLNLNENENDALSLNVLGGAGISDDIAIIQNNLRNISTISYNSISSGFFFFGEDQGFVFTNDDIVGVSTDVSVGSTTLFSDENYYVCNSDSRTKFKLSTRPSTSNLGISTILVSSVSTTNFNFVRKDSVFIDNLVNFVKPEIDDLDFTFLEGNSIKNAFESTQNTHDIANTTISTKYSGISDLDVNRQILIEGTLSLKDPSGFNISATKLNDTKSPGVFVNGVRAFSSNNNPWEKVGTALSTSSQQVTVGELHFENEITITGISTELSTVTAVTSFTHKIPSVINGETYYLLLTT